MNLQQEFKTLQKKYFPKLNDIQLVKRKQSYFMISPPFSRNIYYSEPIMKQCPSKARTAALVHELYHKEQFKKYNPLSRLLIWIGYFISLKIRINIEREAHIETIKKGFAEGTKQLREFVKKRYSKKSWEKEHKKLHLTNKEINRMKK